MKSFTLIAISSIALMVKTINAACNPDCINTVQSQLNAQCGNGSNAPSNACLCTNYARFLQCYSNCNDPTSQTEVMNYQAQARNICSNASMGNGLPANNQFFGANGQITPIMGPTPTINGLFAASTVGTDLRISSGNTEVIVPFSGMPQNTNTPVLGSLYSSYALGSITVGYKSTTPSFTFRSVSDASSIGSSLIPASIITLISTFFLTRA